MSWNSERQFNEAFDVYYENLNINFTPMKNKKKKQFRSMNEVNLDIHYYTSQRNEIDAKIQQSINKMNHMEMTNPMYRGLAKKLVELGEEHERYSDLLIKLHRELSKIQIKNLDHGTND